MPRSYRQQGQSLLWFLAFAATMAMTFVGVYSVGQTTTEKQKTVNAADAAAYSGAMVQARVLNMVAYTNRAEIANEVMLAQLVSMQSWLGYMQETIQSFELIANTLSLIPPIAPLMQGAARVMNVVENAIGYVGDLNAAATRLAVPAVEVAYSVVYSTLKLVVFEPSGLVMAHASRSAAENVLAANKADQNGKLDTAPSMISNDTLLARNALNWRSAFKLYKKNTRVGSASDGRRNAAEVLLESRDSFSEERKGARSGFFSYLWGSGQIRVCPVFLLGASKDGPTTLVNYERWEAQDTSVYRLNAGGCKGDGLPYGWGRATLARNQEAGNRRTNPHRAAGLLAYGEVEKFSGWTGVKELYDVDRNRSNDRPLDSGGQKYFKEGEEDLSFVVAVAKNKNAVRNNETLGFLDRDSASHLGNTKLAANYLEDQIAAKSEAKVFFSRPARNTADFTGAPLFRGDSHKEYASLYNPYWQVRLTDSGGLSFANALIYGGRLDLAVFSQ